MHNFFHTVVLAILCIAGSAAMEYFSKKSVHFILGKWYLFADARIALYSRKW